MAKYLLEYQKADVVPLPNLVKLDYVWMVLYTCIVVKKMIHTIIWSTCGCFEKQRDGRSCLLTRILRILISLIKVV